MRHRWIVMLGLGLAAVAFMTVYRGRPEPTPVGTVASRVTDAWLAAVHAHARAGDWLVVRGTHIGDQLVAAASASELTHAAVYDPERDEVIEAVGKGVLRTPVRELLAESHRLLIIEPRGYTPEAGAAAVARARGHVGSDYDWLGTVGLQSDRRFYCTELALDAWDARAKGWMPSGVIHPDQMARFGEVLFDSTRRRDVDDEAAAVGEELRGRFARVLDEARGVDYAAKVAPGIYRGGVPDAEGIAWLKSIGVRTIINLRHFHGSDEGRRVRAAGMRYERIALASTEAPDSAQVRAFLDLVTDPEAAPVYVHCLHGVDRTGAMIALYRMEVQGWTNSDALAEMEWFGAHDLLKDLRRFVGAYTPLGGRRARGRPAVGPSSGL